MRRFLLKTTTLVAALGSPVAAQSVNPDPHGDHGQAQEVVIVTAGYARDRSEVLNGTSVLTSDDLDRALRTTIGETLSRQAGVSATSFGPNASRPVLRGFQGERVRVLTDGIGSFDVSNTSVDHAVTINPLTADRVEVLRGPGVLLFGSSAIGGVVNVIQSRIPRSVPDETVHIDAIASLGSAAGEVSYGTRIDVAVSKRLVLHFDGSYANSDDLRIGGAVLTPQLRATALASGNKDIAALATLAGTLPNSAAKSNEISGGAAYISDAFNIGFSVSQSNNLYGLPTRYALDPGVEAESVRLDVQQLRGDLRGEVELSSGLFELIRLRAGYADYQHDELAETGDIGTTFFAKAWEARLEFVQRANNGHRGASGAQYFSRRLNIVGDEKFLPENQTDQLGIFTLQSLDFGAIKSEVGARVEQTRLTARADKGLGNPDLSRQFTTVSGSLGGSFEIVPSWRVGLTAAYSQRAPSAEELFANGPHAGTQAFESGNPNFKRETSTGFEASLHSKGQRLALSASLYYNSFNGFIYEQPTGEIEDDLPVFQFLQADAQHFGGEMEAHFQLGRIGQYDWHIDGVADYTRASITNGGGDLPRIPALRLLAGLETKSDFFDARIEVEWVDGQTRVADFETPTREYTLINASAVFRPFGTESQTTVTVSANNIFNQEARRHVSFLKDYAPLAGRDIRIIARTSF